MLILTRKTNESITLEIGEYVIKLLVVRIEPNKVRLGFEADNKVSIVRDDVICKHPRQSKFKDV